MAGGPAALTLGNRPWCVLEDEDNPSLVWCEDFLSSLRGLWATKVNHVQWDGGKIMQRGQSKFQQLGPGEQNRLTSSHCLLCLAGKVYDNVRSKGRRESRIGRGRFSPTVTGGIHQTRAGIGAGAGVWLRHQSHSVRHGLDLVAASVEVGIEPGLDHEGEWWGFVWMNGRKRQRRRSKLGMIQVRDQKSGVG